MLAEEMTEEERHDPSKFKGCVSGPRHRLPECWIQEQLLMWNAHVRELGWGPIELISERRVTSLLRARIFFELEGQGYPLQSFVDALNELQRKSREGRA